MSAPIPDVAIIGAGFTGVALAIQLTRSLRTGARILLVGAPQATGRGQAYATEVPGHLLNVRVARMSLHRTTRIISSAGWRKGSRTRNIANATSRGTPTAATSATR